MIRRRQVSRTLWWAVSGRGSRSRSEGDAMQEKDNIDCDDDLTDGCGLLLRWVEGAVDNVCWNVYYNITLEISR